MASGPLIVSLLPSGRVNVTTASGQIEVFPVYAGSLSMKFGVGRQLRCVGVFCPTLPLPTALPFAPNDIEIDVFAFAEGMIASMLSAKMRVISAAVAL